MNTIRAFFAIDLPTTLKEKIEKRVKEIALPIDIKYTPTENMHLTILFLGNLAMDNLEKIVEIGRKVFENIQPIDFYGTNISVAPNQNFARMLWLNLELNQEIAKLKRQLEKKLEENGIAFEKEDRALKLHITLARFKPVKIDWPDIKFPIHFKATEVCLMESKLQKPHAVYLPLKKFILGKIEKNKKSEYN